MTTSCLDHSAKCIVKQKALTLGAHMISEWTSDCTLVIMTSLSVTIKVGDILLPILNYSGSPCVESVVVQI